MAKIKIVLFVEGDTEFAFFNALLCYYKQQSKRRIAEYEVVNMKGVTRYTSKFIGKLENELIPKAVEGVLAKKKLTIKSQLLPRLTQIVYSVVTLSTSTITMSGR